MSINKKGRVKNATKVDKYGLHFRLFKYYLKKHNSKMRCYLVRNHKQVDEMIQDIKSSQTYNAEE